LGLWVATTTSTKNVDFVRGLGADLVVDYTKDDPASVRDLDAVIDTLGPESELKALALVKRGGVVVGLSGMPDASAPALPSFTKPIVWFQTRARRAAVKRTGVRFEYVFMRPDGAMLAEIAGWVNDGKLRPILHRTYPLAEVKEAFAELERGRARGKIVVEVS
jgi:NADPH:quinone reductase-like Zn-dependent oxidoreductase